MASALLVAGTAMAYPDLSKVDGVMYRTAKDGDRFMFFPDAEGGIKLEPTWSGGQFRYQAYCPATDYLITFRYEGKEPTCLIVGDGAVDISCIEEPWMCTMVCDDDSMRTFRFSFDEGELLVFYMKASDTYEAHWWQRVK